MAQLLDALRCVQALSSGIVELRKRVSTTGFTREENARAAKQRDQQSRVEKFADEMATNEKLDTLQAAPLTPYLDDVYHHDLDSILSSQRALLRTIRNGIKSGIRYEAYADCAAQCAQLTLDLADYMGAIVTTELDAVRAQETEALRHSDMRPAMVARATKPDAPTDVYGAPIGGPISLFDINSDPTLLQAMTPYATPLASASQTPASSRPPSPPTVSTNDLMSA